MPSFAVPSQQPYGGGFAPGGSYSGGLPTFASLAAAQASASAIIGVGSIIGIVGAVNANELSFYQLQTGTPTQASPAQFQPSDNSNLVYTLVK